MSVATKTQPWYCRKGRGHRERIDRLIAAKREREARLAGVNQKNHDYFENWERQTEWLTHSHSHHNGSVVKKTRVPYDLDYEPVVEKRKIVAANGRVDQAKKEMVKKYRVYLEADQIGRNSIEEGDRLCYQIETLLTLTRSMRDKRETWDIRERKLYYNRFAKDKLRSKIFLICEQLNYYKIIIECLNKSSAEKYLGRQEKEQLNSVVESSLDIINTYMRINQNRNSELIPMYNEEAQRRWFEFESLWDTEKPVWYKVVDTVMEAFLMIFKCKLEENLSEQEKHLERKSKALQSLTTLVNRYQQDSELSLLLDIDINELTRQDITD